MYYYLPLVTFFLILSYSFVQSPISSQQMLTVRLEYYIEKETKREFTKFGNKTTKSCLMNGTNK